MYIKKSKQKINMQQKKLSKHHLNTIYTRKHHNTQTRTTIQKKNNTLEFNKYFSFTKQIYNTLEILKQDYNISRPYYYIINKKYNKYFQNRTYQITDFLLYCMLRFTESIHQHLFTEFVKFPVRFPMKNYITHSDKYQNYNTFNKNLYLNNFIYNMLENNKNLQTIINESKPNKWGYNIKTINIEGMDYYNIYYVTKYKGDVTLFTTQININYPAHLVKKYIIELIQFIKQYKLQLKSNNLLTDIFLFYNNKKLNYNTKYIIIDGYYLPKCNIEWDEQINNSVIDNIVYYEISYPIPDRIRQMTYVFNKLRNINQLKKDLQIAGISREEYNSMIRNIKPLCFENKKLYHTFIKELATILVDKFKNFIIKIVGSSTLFYSASIEPIKKDKFYTHNTSDIDVSIIINENFDNYRHLLEAPEIDIIKSTGIYPNHKTRLFLGEDKMSKFFNKWGPQESLYVPQNTTKIEDTLLKREIGIVIIKKQDLYDYPDIINNNKTCLTNFTTFIKNGKTISYWNENNQYITISL
jgi:hypothetical protein